MIRARRSRRAACPRRSPPTCSSARGTELQLRERFRGARGGVLRPGRGGAGRSCGAARSRRRRPLSSTRSPRPARSSTPGSTSRCTSTSSPGGSGRAATSARSCRGLIQVAVGFQHLANGNAAGARAPARRGRDAPRAAGRSAGWWSTSLARAAGECSRMLEAGEASPGRFDWTAVPSVSAGAEKPDALRPARGRPGASTDPRNFVKKEHSRGRFS